MTKQRIIRIAMMACLIGFTSNSFSQSTINTASNAVKIDGKIFEYTIGDMTLISTEKNNNLIITQGYLQPQGKASISGNAPSDYLTDLTDKVKVYPNPTENILFIETIDALADNLNFQLIDASGKVVLKRNEDQLKGNNKFSLDLSSIAAGSYFLLIDQKNTEPKLNNLSFKIQKLH